MKIDAPGELAKEFTFTMETPDEDVNKGVELAVNALWKGMAKKAGIIVPTVSGRATYPNWIHPYDNFWINKVSSYFFPRASVEWPIRLFATYQTPLGEIGGGVYDIPEEEWQVDWEDAEGPEKWQPWVARPIADHLAHLDKHATEIQYGIYVRDHLFVLQVNDQWMQSGNMAFLIEMYEPCRKALKYLDQHRDLDKNGLVETTCILSDVVVAGDEDIHSTERAEDQVMVYGALIAFASMARLLGGDEDAAWADAWAARIKEGLERHFWRPEGRYIFGIDRATKQPRLGYVTTTYANGYAILFGLATGEYATAILEFMNAQEFVVPGPYHIPPVRVEDKPGNPPGVYCNGGCGWGRGIMPSIALACYANGRPGQGFDYLKRQAIAAREAGSFHEYWTWEQHAGETKPGGAPWYCETSSGFLDVLLHGTFGILPVEPGFKKIQLFPQLPGDWSRAKLGMHLPNGGRLELTYTNEPGMVSLDVDAGKERRVSIKLCWTGDGKPSIEREGLTISRVENVGKGWLGTGEIRGGGKMVLRT